jgi:hypothetical protein
VSQGVADRSHHVSQGVANSIKKDTLEEEHHEMEKLETEGLLEQASFGKEDISRSALTTAQRNLLLAFEVQLQVQQYAEAAIAAMKAQEQFSLEDSVRQLPSNLQNVLKGTGGSRSGATARTAPASPAVEPCRPAGGVGSRASCDEVRALLKELNKPCNGVCSGYVAGDAAYAGQESDAARRASRVVRGDSMRPQRQDL